MLNSRILGLLSAGLLCIQSFAAIPSALEPEYADAVLALHDGKTAEALQHMENILRQSPEQIETLALHALTIKNQGKLPEARAAYEKILKVLTINKAPDSELAPYHFELGVLALQSKDPVNADLQLNYALQSKFNLPATHFFMGLSAFQQRDWRRAEVQFHLANEANVMSLKPTTFLYLGQLSKRRADVSRAIFYFSQSERWANADGENARVTNDAVRASADTRVKELAEQELLPYRETRWSGQIGLASGYDSNVLSAPDGITGASGNGSMRETLLWAIGFATGAADNYQFVPTYHGSFNYNTNPDTKIGEFLTHTVTVFMNSHPSAPESWGLKAEAQVIWGYADNQSSFSPYSLVGSVGPYYRKTLANQWELRGELYAHPQDYFNDDLFTSDQARTGWGVTPRLALQHQTYRGLWNPTAALLGDYTHTSGVEYQSKTVALELADVLYPDKLWSVEFSGSLGVASYGNRLGTARSDKLLTLRGTATRSIGRNFALSGDLAYLADYSNIDSYAYSRVVTSLAINYLF